VSTVDVGSQVSGKIVKLQADFNARVKKGDILAEIDPASFKDAVAEDEDNLKIAQATLGNAQVAVDLAKKEYDRSIELFDKGMISSEDKEISGDTYLSAKDDVLLSQAGVRQVQAELESSRTDLANTIIRSPIDGVVLSRQVNLGQTIAARMQAPVLFQIANDIKTLMVECDIDETDVGNVKTGQQLRFQVTAFPDDTFRGKIIQVRIGPDTGQNVITYKALVEAENPEGKLLPGMTATVTVIIAEARNVLRVSNAALNFEPSLSKAKRTKTAATLAKKPLFSKPAPDVYLRKGDGSLVRVSIQAGLSDNAFTEVISGDINEGDVIITGLNTNRSS
jgi:HlyD family secretion protein